MADALPVGLYTGEVQKSAKRGPQILTDYL